MIKDNYLKITFLGVFMMKKFSSYFKSKIYKKKKKHAKYNFLEKNNNTIF